MWYECDMYYCQSLLLSKVPSIKRATGMMKFNSCRIHRIHHGQSWSIMINHDRSWSTDAQENQKLQCMRSHPAVLAIRCLWKLLQHWRGPRCFTSLSQRPVHQRPCLWLAGVDLGPATAARACYIIECTWSGSMVIARVHFAGADLHRLVWRWRLCTNLSIEFSRRSERRCGPLPRSSCSITVQFNFCSQLY